MSEPLRDLPAGACELDVLVSPRAAHNRLAGVHDGRLKVQLTAPPVDGAANAALCEVLAAKLDLPKSALEIARGATGRRKTVRIAGLSAALARARLGLAALVGSLFMLAAGCVSEIPFALKVVLPEESADLNRADNLALELGPDAYFVSYPVRGTDFELELEFDPDIVERTLSLYLADGKDLLAYGRTVPFVLASPPSDLAILMARPGVLSIYPGEAAEPDPDLLAAYAPARGLMLLSSAGDIALLNEATLDVELGARLADAPAPSDGAFVADPSGRMWRVAVAEGLRADMYDPARDAWYAGKFVGDPEPPRPGAAWALGRGRERLYLAGGGGRTDLVAVSLEPDDEGVLERTAVADLDGPRVGARLLAIVRGETDTLVLVGGDADVPAVFFPDSVRAVGPVGAWTDLQCIAMDPAETATDTVRLLCAGGLRGGQPTGDALLIRLPANTQDAAVEELPALFVEPLADPRLFADDLAVYAQAAGQWWRVDRDDLDVSVVDGSAARVTGGHSITVGTGVTFLVGGRDLEDRAVDQWWIFAPSLPSP